MTINSSLLRSYPASDHIRNVNDINRTALKTSASAKTSTIPKPTDPGAAAEKTTPATPTYPPNNGRLNLGSTNIPNNPKTAIHPKRNRNRSAHRRVQQTHDRFPTNAQRNRFNLRTSLAA